MGENSQHAFPQIIAPAALEGNFLLGGHDSPSLSIPGGYGLSGTVQSVFDEFFWVDGLGFQGRAPGIQLPSGNTITPAILRIRRNNLLTE